MDSYVVMNIELINWSEIAAHDTSLYSARTDCPRTMSPEERHDAQTISLKSDALKGRDTRYRANEGSLAACCPAGA